MKPVFTLFPKFLQPLTLDTLATRLSEIGIDHVDLVVRDGFWVTPGGIGREAERFVEQMRKSGLGVRLATTSYTPEQLLADPEPLRILSALSVEAVRIGYFSYSPQLAWEAQLDAAARQLARLAELCDTCGIRAIYQVHHGYSQLIQHAVSARRVVEPLPSDRIGVMLDPGNQFFEGREHYGRAAELLGDHLAAIGIKDVAVQREPDRAQEPGKGWRTVWVPCHEGLIDWPAIASQLRSCKQPVLLNMQPFYEPHDTERHLAALREEWHYLKTIFAEEERS